MKTLTAIFAMSVTRLEELKTRMETRTHCAYSLGIHETDADTINNPVSSVCGGAQDVMFFIGEVAAHGENCLESVAVDVVHPWEYDNEMKWNTRKVHSEHDGDIFVFTYKTPGGDYAISAMREGDIAGGEVEYRPNLRRAKAFADALISSGAYRDYLM